MLGSEPWLLYVGRKHGKVRISLSVVGGAVIEAGKCPEKRLNYPFGVLGDSKLTN